MKEVKEGRTTEHDNEKRKKKNTSTRNAGLVTFFLFVRFNHIEKVGLVSVC